MKANELMVNDWVSYEGAKCRVAGFLYGKCEVTFPRIGETIYDVPLKYILPIPLTPEILEKNGFVPDNFSPYYLPIEDGSIRFSKHQYGLYCNILLPYQRYDGVCNYVHQLQHALRLCGIEKEIVI